MLLALAALDFSILVLCSQGLISCLGRFLDSVRLGFMGRYFSVRCLSVKISRVSFFFFNEGKQVWFKDDFPAKDDFDGAMKLGDRRDAFVGKCLSMRVADISL